MKKKFIEQLDPGKVELFNKRYNKKKKNVFVTYLLRMFVLGFHRAYLKHGRTTFRYFVSLIFVIGIIRRIIDAFRIPSMVQEYNDDLAASIYNEIK